jgi:hypothetical protein
VGIFRKFAKAYRVLDSETYKETMRSAEGIARASYGMLADKSTAEQAQILERVTSLSEKVNDAVDQETPLVVALTLLTAIRFHHQAIQQQVDKLRPSP